MGDFSNIYGEQPPGPQTMEVEGTFQCEFCMQTNDTGEYYPAKKAILVRCECGHLTEVKINLG